MGGLEAGERVSMARRRGGWVRGTGAGSAARGRHAMGGTRDGRHARRAAPSHEMKMSNTVW